MKKKYLCPETELVIVQTETLLDAASSVKGSTTDHADDPNNPLSPNYQGAKGDVSNNWGN